MSEIVDPRTVPVRFTRLKNIASSPAHYFDSVQHDGDDSLARRIGRGVHALLFGQPVAVWTGKVRRGKEWDAWSAEHSGKVVLNIKERDHAGAVANAVRSDPQARELLFADGTKLERTIEWRVNGRLCRGTPDAYNRRAVTDLKTHRRMPPARFISTATWAAYHSQVPWYANGLISLDEIDEDAGQYIVAVESSRPYPVTTYRLTPGAIDMGQRLYTAWMETLATCEAANQWPAYAQSIQPFHVEEPTELIFGDEEDEPALDDIFGPVNTEESEAA